jgi:hypothetical protein
MQNAALKLCSVQCRGGRQITLSSKCISMPLYSLPKVSPCYQDATRCLVEAHYDHYTHDHARCIVRYPLDGTEDSMLEGEY